MTNNCRVRRTENPFNVMSYNMIESRGKNIMKFGLHLVHEQNHKSQENLKLYIVLQPLQPTPRH